MSVSATINAAFNINSATYNASLSVPSENPTGDAPFIFKVTSQANTAPDAPPAEVNVLLKVAVGGSKQVYVAVKPPMALINGAVGPGLVKELDVVVAEGAYDDETGKFT